MATTNTNAGAVTDSGTLTVTGIPPTLILPPSDEMTVAEGADVSINCKVDGLPRPWHRWLNVSILGAKIQTSKKFIFRKQFFFQNIWTGFPKNSLFESNYFF